MVEQTSRKPPLTGDARTLVIWSQRRILALSRQWFFWANLSWGVLVALPWMTLAMMRIGARTPAQDICLFHGNNWPSTLTGNILPSGSCADGELGSLTSWVRLTTGFLFGLAAVWMRCSAAEIFLQDTRQALEPRLQQARVLSLQS